MVFMENNTVGEFTFIVKVKRCNIVFDNVTTCLRSLNVPMITE